MVEVALAGLSGVLGSLCFPPFGLHWLVWITFVPLCAVVRGRGLRHGFWLGYVTGVVGFAGAFFWVWESVARFLAVSSPAAAPFFLVFLGWHALQLAVFAAAIAGAGRRSAIAAPLAWVSAEYLFPKLFPWYMGNVLQPHLPFLQLGDLTGPAGSSFAIMLVNGLFADSLERWRNRRRWQYAALSAFAVVAGLEAFGRWRISQIESDEREASRLSVAIVQGNLPPVRAANDADVERSLRIHSELSQRARSGQPRLIVWPEAALRTFLMRDTATQQAVFALAEDLRTSLLVGAAGVARGGDELSSAFLVSPYGEFAGQYDKSHLLPFAERLPDGLQFIGRWWPSYALVTGPTPTALLLPGTRFAPSICYESTFAGFFRPGIRDGAEFLVNITNDAWFGDTGGPHHHLQAAVMRAVESRRWLVRAANSGVSAIISPTGRIAARTELFAPATLGGEIRLRQDHSVYMRWGDWFVYVCLIALPFALFPGLNPRRLGLRRTAGATAP